MGAAALIWCGILGMSGPLFAQQQKPQPPPKPALQQPVNFDEARAIVEAAREHRQQVRNKPDCSNLVHEVYRRAGFEYAYAPSRELHAGVENFVRVKQPQRGDLIVWPGHVGIVVEPAMRAFYSAVKSGLRLDFYDSPYWRKRGPARFFRYLTRRIELPHNTLAKSVPSKDAVGAVTPAAVVPSGEARGHSVRAVSPADGSGRAWPNTIVVRTSRRSPTKNDIARAVSQLTAEAAHVLNRRDPRELDVPLAIVDQIKVEGVQVGEDRGRAWIQSRVKLSIAEGHLDPTPVTERRLWELQRTRQGWLLVAPQNRAYVSRQVAMRTLQAELASLKKNLRAADDSDDSAEMESRQKLATQMLSVLAERE